MIIAIIIAFALVMSCYGYGHIWEQTKVTFGNHTWRSPHVMQVFRHLITIMTRVTAE